MKNFSEKKAKLNKLLTSGSTPVVAYSGGVDSTLVLYLANHLRQGDVLGVLVRTEAQGKKELARALTLGRELHLRVETVDLDILKIPQVAKNHRDRCYHCKCAMLQAIKNRAEEYGYTTIYDGSNLDDVGEIRPGTAALNEYGIISPLKECEFTKTNVRQLAREMRLGNWNKPAAPCLLTRFPYDLGEEVKASQLRQIEEGELLLNLVCQDNFRLRWEGEESVRIEASEPDMKRILGKTHEIRDSLANIGFSKVVLDLRPFQSGSFDREVKL